MSILEMKVPSPGESISEVEIASWLVEDGEYVHKDQTIADCAGVMGRTMRASLYNVEVTCP